MNILIASDSFKDVYNPVEACDIIAGALSGIQAKLVKLPMCDGGEYAYEVLRDSFHYEERVLEGVLNAYGKQMQVRYLVNGSEAHVISSEVVRLYPHEEAYKNPLLLTDYGIGQIINEVIQEGYTKIQLYLGGTSTVCAGMGMAQALGARFFSYSNEIMPAPIRGKDLKNIKRIEYEPQNNAVTLSVIVDGNAKAYEMEGITNLKIGKTFNVERREILKTCNKGIRNIINVTGVLENQDFSGAAGGILFGIEQCFRNVSYCLGSDYFVLPSSIHEVLILPDNGLFEVPELNAMVKEVNETQVERQEQLSDKVQFCDGKTVVMENAERREARLEKEKAAEKAEVKGGIHGRLEKAKAEIKAKEVNKAPKDKAKNLAEVL